MGIANSREPYGLRPRRGSPSPGRGIFGGRNNRRGQVRRRRSSVTTQAILPFGTVPISHQNLYGPYYGNRQGPIYSPFNPMSSPYLPISYNNYSAPQYIPPQYMMPQQQRIAPYMSPPALPPPPPPSMPTPYVQQPQIQPIYNNIGGYPVPASMGALVGTGLYPPSYPSAPVRILTDWTAGGQISPGFLGPPI